MSNLKGFAHARRGEKYEQLHVMEELRRFMCVCVCFRLCPCDYLSEYLRLADRRHNVEDIDSFGPFEVSELYRDAVSSCCVSISRPELQKTPKKAPETTFQQFTGLCQK